MRIPLASILCLYLPLLEVKYLFFDTFFAFRDYDTAFMHERVEDLRIFEGFGRGNENNAYCVCYGTMMMMDHGMER